MGKLFVISYDISDNNSRVKTANLLKSFGERVQLSVFECWLNERELDILVDRIKKVVDLSSDSVRIYQTRIPIRIVGSGPLPEEPGSFVV